MSLRSTPSRPATPTCCGGSRSWRRPGREHRGEGSQGSGGQHREVEAVGELIGALPWIFGGFVLILALAVLKKPVKWLGKVAARTGVGLAVLLLLSKVGGFIGVTLGVNLFNALVMGVLGAPGFGLLLMLNWVLH
ncbi:MAG TPA: pro-sigmaK processing inhibitor BofA family protein [Candidatus Galloscillospira excrementavium]|nr:pro-sigmaK processing inhibitor BofA family protein [Candidatus Galloscillospira excrementavium]